MNELSQSIEINASPDEVFHIITDLPAMGRLSPENTGGTWLNGAQGPAVGAKFKGTNANGAKSWTTLVTVVEFAPPSAFAFEVKVGPAKVARWAYAVEATPSGSRVTESWKDQRNAISKWIGGKSSGVEHRDEFTARSIQTTLENLKKTLEQAQ
ncbi:MAG: SRPBCC family protein [Acidimicrobiales bacterium]